ncbi:unnamed protein product [Heligmosomoides polygyrus]|uniref:Uncharacterized protein n=1 Tax=Heligmosomoides polygyrus TaxID=6339 RepID=A0A183FQN4_HELPZ|nr:unnamed protein product [Heligmosomoides polygyrus]
MTIQVTWQQQQQFRAESRRRPAREGGVSSAVAASRARALARRQFRSRFVTIGSSERKAREHFQTSWTRWRWLERHTYGVGRCRSSRASQLKPTRMSTPEDGAEQSTAGWVKNGPSSRCGVDEKRRRATLSNRSRQGLSQHFSSPPSDEKLALFHVGRTGDTLRLVAAPAMFSLT